MNRDAIGGTITIVTLVITLVLVVAVFYACRSGGTDHLRKNEYEDVGAAPDASPTLRASAAPERRPGA